MLPAWCAVCELVYSHLVVPGRILALLLGLLVLFESVSQLLQAPLLLCHRLGREAALRTGIDKFTLHRDTCSECNSTTH